MRLARTILAALVLGVGTPAFAQSRPFTQRDYETYFSPGHFASASPFYVSQGLMEVVRNKTSDVAGKHVLEQTTDSLDVSVNYDGRSKYAFYKIRSIQTDQMFWDDKRKAYVYDYSEREFDGDQSKVWESKDQKLEVSKEDHVAGLLHKFYRDADTRAGRNAKVSEEAFRKSVTGLWTWRCAWDKQQPNYEVVCTATHEATQRVETFYYRKLDLVG